MITGFSQIDTAKLAYVFVNNPHSRGLVVVEHALGACCGEWWHLVERMAQGSSVLLYDRAGYGTSEPSKLERTPANVARELRQLLEDLGLTEKELILVGHSQGALYAQAYARAHPERLRGLVLLDPATTEDAEFQKRLTASELQTSGVDKSSGFRMGKRVCALGLGALLKPLLRKAPPFYYYDGFSPEARVYILYTLTRKRHYATALAEYELSHRDEHVAWLRDPASFPDVPLVVVTHARARSISESMEFGGASQEVAEKVEDVWQMVMKSCLALSSRSEWIQARSSGHYIHLSEPELLFAALERLRSSAASTTA